MNCILYSMEQGKVVISDLHSVRIRSSNIHEIYIYPNHRPIIGDIEGEFEVIHNDHQPNQIYYVNTGFFEFKNNILTVVANFK